MLNIRIVFLLIAAWVCRVTGQLLPQNTCPQYFQYIFDGNQIYGQIVFQHLHAGEHHFEITLSNRGLPRSSYKGSLDPYPDVNAAAQNLLAGRPIILRVNFPMPSQPPILTSLSHNGNVLCTATGYPAPNSWFQLYYSIHAGTVNSNRMTYTDEFDKKLPDYSSRPHYPDAPSVIIIPVTRRPFYPNSDSPRTVIINRPAPAITTPTIPPTRSSDRREIDVPVQSSLSPRPQTQPSSIPNRNSLDIDAVCGLESAFVSPLIFGGTEVSRGQFPWMAAIYQKNEGDLIFRCGGTLVTRRNVITAAHCVQSFNVTTVTVYLGRNDLVSIEDGIQALDLQEIIIHPDYKKGTPDADVAILVMNPLDSFTRFIKPICLWKDLIDNRNMENMQATVVGWGNHENGHYDSNVARMVEVKIVEQSVCQSFWKDFGDIVTERTFCAGNELGGGPCVGDSGGGLMMLRNERWILRGVVSVGQSNRQKCNAKKFAIYCDVAQHMNWIQPNLNFY